MSEEVDWFKVYEYLNEHKDEYCFNSILDGIIEANNRGLDGIDYYEEIFTKGKYDCSLDEDVEVVKETDDEIIEIDFSKFIQDIARTEDKHKFDDDHRAKDKSFLLGWLIVCPDGTCGCDESYTNKFEEACDSANCYKYGEECNCANAYCFHVEDLASMLKTILPGIEF